MSAACRASRNDCVRSDLMETAKDVIELDLRVLGFIEDGRWCALALELDLCGVGKSFDEAMIDLTNAIEAQVSFAIQHDNLDGILTPAPIRYFQAYKNSEKITNIDGINTKETRVKTMRRVFRVSSHPGNWIIDE